MIESDLLDFVRSSFRSVWTLELLLFLRRNSAQSWSSPDLVRELRASELVVREGLATLERVGLVSPEADGMVRYAAAHPQLDQLVTRLDALYRERPLAVMQAIFSPSDKLQTLADAFKFKKE